MESLFYQGSRIPSGPGLETYREWIAAAPGLKLLGHPAWLQGREETPLCSAGHPMTFFFQMESTGSYTVGDDRWGNPGQAPHGVQIHDCGRMYFFVCSHCESRPVRAIIHSL